VEAFKEMMDAKKAKMGAMQEKTNANLKEIRHESQQRRKDARKADHELLAKMETNKARTEYTQEAMNTQMDTYHEKMEAAIHSLRAWQEETMVCQGKMEACLECKEQPQRTWNPKWSIGRHLRNMPQ
jgi:hypothetical protein